jgi:hypothetical protein
LVITTGAEQMSCLDLIMFTSGFTMVAFATIVTIKALGELFQFNWEEFFAGLGAIGIAFIVNAIGCILMWGALK